MMGYARRKAEIDMGSDNTIEDLPEDAGMNIYHFTWVIEKEINKKVYIVLFILLVLAVLLGVMGGYSIWGI